MSLGTGITSAFLHVLGKLAVRREVLIIDLIEGKMAGRQSLITRIGILSIPGALFEAIDLTMVST